MKIHILLAALISSLLPTTILANNNFTNRSSTEFFASNNPGEIDLQTAFHRLHGKEQQKLQDDTINLMQEEHIEQSKFENLLGTYKMSADNSEKVITSSLQKLSLEETFKIAAKLANVLKQESIAVFIPANEPIIADTVLKFKSHHTIHETILMIREKLPAQYSQAFSLHLEIDSCSNFENAIVDGIEWLGSKINSDEIKKSFPQEEVTYRYGKAFLVYKDGHKEQL
jgi:hypothetical protein